MLFSTTVVVGVSNFLIFYVAFIVLSPSLNYCYCCATNLTGFIENICTFIFLNKFIEKLYPDNIHLYHIKP